MKNIRDDIWPGIADNINHHIVARNLKINTNIRHIKYNIKTVININFIVNVGRQIKLNTSNKIFNKMFSETKSLIESQIKSQAK